MEWTDEGIVLGVRRHGESSAIVELLTRSHGRHLGLVRGGAGKRMRPLLQPGNSVTTVWRARLDEHLGYYAIEGTRLRAATLLASAHATYGVTHLASLVRLLPERDPHEDIYEMLDRTLDDFPCGERHPAHELRHRLPRPRLEGEEQRPFRFGILRRPEHQHPARVRVAKGVRRELAGRQPRARGGAGEGISAG